MQRAFDQPCIGRFMLAERNNAGDAGLFGAALEMGELRDIAIDDCRAARLDAEKDFRLGVGDLGQRAEVLQMHRRDRGDDRDMRADQPRQRLDLAFVIHAHFEHGVTCACGASGERQRHAPVVVVGRDGGMGLAVLRQRKPQRLLGSGLADRAGDADHLGLRARSRGHGESAQSGKHIGHDEERRIAGKLAAPVGGDDGEAGFSGKCRGDKIVAVAIVALDGKERVARRQAAAIDGQAKDRFRQRAEAFGAHRAHHRLGGPQRGRAHAASSLSAVATAS